MLCNYLQNVAAITYIFILQQTVAKQTGETLCPLPQNRQRVLYASNGEMALYEFLSQLLSYGTYCIVGVLAVTGLETVTETLMEALDPLCRIVLLLCGALGVAKGALNAGALVVMLGYFYEYNELISDLKYMVTQLHVLRNLEERISVFYRDQESAEKEVLTVLPEGIEIENLHFSYENALGEVLRGLNIHIPLTGKIMLYGI